MGRYPDKLEILSVVKGGTHNMYGQQEIGGGWDSQGNPVADTEGFSFLTDCRIESKGVQQVNGNDGKAIMYYYVAFCPRIGNLPSKGDRVRVNGLHDSLVNHLAVVDLVSPTYGNVKITLIDARP